MLLVYFCLLREISRGFHVWQNNTLVLHITLRNIPKKTRLIESKGQVRVGARQDHFGNAGWFRIHDSVNRTFETQESNNFSKPISFVHDASNLLQAYFPCSVFYIWLPGNCSMTFGVLFYSIDICHSFVLIKQIGGLWVSLYGSLASNNCTQSNNFCSEFLY